MKFLTESLSEMNLGYLHIDEKCLSYHELLQKFVLTEEEVVVRERSNTLAKTRVEKPKERDIEKDRDHYYNVKLNCYKLGTRRVH